MQPAEFRQRILLKAREQARPGEKPFPSLIEDAMIDVLCKLHEELSRMRSRLHEIETRGTHD